jgi:hypothetical protein
MTGFSFISVFTEISINSNSRQYFLPGEGRLLMVSDPLTILSSAKGQNRRLPA